MVRSTSLSRAIDITTTSATGTSCPYRCQALVLNLGTEHQAMLPAGTCAKAAGSLAAVWTFVTLALSQQS
jgi:hypothetical protein